MDDGERPVGPQVYPPREDTWLLVERARVGPGVRVLEIGAGTGLAALEAARSGARVVATDLNRRALVELRERAVREGLELDAVRTDLARGLGRFDVVLANPPYLPTVPGSEEEDPGDRWALDGGPDGTRITARLVAELPEHLAGRGSAFVVVSTVQPTASLERIRGEWVRAGGAVATVAERALEGERLSVWRLTRP
jgi:release factor glutamine methyltransferase